MNKIGQISINLITNILAISTSMLISIWITPYLIQKLGLAAFGYVGLINNLINFMTIITFTLTSMVGRFLIVSLERNGPSEASVYVSSALFTNIFFGIVLIPLFIFLSSSLDKIFIIQSEYVTDAKLSFFLIGIAFILSPISLVFSTGAYCRNRLDIKNGINILSNIVRLAFLVFIFSISNARIWHVAIASVLQVSLSIIFYVFSYKSLLPEVHYSIRLFNVNNSIEVLSSGFLISIIMLGNNLITQIDLLVGNQFLPAETVGLYAAVLLLPNSVRNIADALSSAFTPTTISLYSSGNMDELRKYTNRVVKFCGLSIGWLVAIIGGLAIPILKIWLDKDYSPYKFIIVLMVLPLTIHLAVNPLFNVQQATNKVKIPALAAVIFGFLNLILAIHFTDSLGMGLFGIVLSGVITSTLRYSFFIPIYTSVITNQPKLVYYKGLFSPLLISSATCTIGLLLQKLFFINNFFSIVCFAIGLSIIYFTLSIGFSSKDERKIISDILISRIRKLSAISTI